MGEPFLPYQGLTEDDMLLDEDGYPLYPDEDMFADIDPEMLEQFYGEDMDMYQYMQDMQNYRHMKEQELVKR